MKKLFSIILYFTFFNICMVNAQYKTNLVLKNEFKNDMLKAIESAKITDSLYQLVLKIENKNPLTLGYLGTLEALKAKHAWNPYQKYKLVKKGINTLNTAVKEAPHDLEIRFMRYTIEYYTPSFLGLNTHLNTDKEKMISILQSQKFNKNELELTKAIAKFLIDTKTCTPEQIQILKPYVQI